jgi:hypothetical protein
MVEWFKALVLKTSVGDEPTVGSNPTLTVVQGGRMKKNLIIGIVVILLVGLLIGLAVIFTAKPKAEPQAEVVPAIVQPAVVEFPAAPKILGVHTVVPKDTLWWISDKWYKDPVLWPAIYEINKDQIADPDLIYVNQKFDIPELNVGKDLSPEDKTLLSQGYLEAYRVYKEKGKKDAGDYKVAGDGYAK